MKFLFTILIAVCVDTSFTIAQTASDYYPMEVGYSWDLHTFPTSIGNFGERITRRIIVGTDSIPIHSARFYCVVNKESLYTHTSWDTYGVFWLRSDPSGNIICGAWGGSEDINTATILNPPFVMYPNGMCSIGYASTIDMGGGKRMVDSTVSNSDVVQVPAGIFTSCLKIIETIDSMGVIKYVDTLYFAPDIGEVLHVRGFPSGKTYRSELINYIVTAVNEESQQPISFSLYQNYPNPFNPNTKIQYSIPSAQFVSLKIYDILGQEIACLVNERKQAGTYEIEYAPSSLATGIYLYRLHTGTYYETKKFILIK